MKKLTLLLLVIGIISTAGLVVNAADRPEITPSQKAEHIAKMKAREAAFEQKLGLTEEQKIKAKELRVQGREKIKPVVEEIKAKKMEAAAIKKSRMAVQMQEEKLSEIDKELKVLEKKANEIRKQNMKEFESILTWRQKMILNKMKKEGRKNFENGKLQK